jgi:hypothetical protein
MQRIVITLLLLLAAGCRCGLLVPVPTDALLFPDRIEFPDTWLDETSDVTFEVRNPGRTSRALTLMPSDEAIEGARQSLLPPGESVTLTLTFRPRLAGPFEGVLLVEDVERGESAPVAIRGLALAVPDCRDTQTCQKSRFDKNLRQCIVVDEPDGTPCASGLACFASAECIHGECRGKNVTCNDGKRCTLDVCNEAGCGSVDFAPYCPTPDNPCEVATCTEFTGCAAEPVPDGTACGLRTCSSARVCINGACVTRVPPANQSCAEVLIGVPAGRGFNDGQGTDVRFDTPVSIAVDDDTAYVSESGVIRKVSSTGVVTTIAGMRLGTRSVSLVDGVAGNARFGPRPLVTAAAKGQLLVFDEGALRQVTPRGVVRTLVPQANGPELGRDGVGAAAILGNVTDAVVAAPGLVHFAVLACPNFCADGGTISLRSANVFGEVRTLGTTHTTFFHKDRDIEVTRAGVVCAKGWDTSRMVETTWRLEARDGGLISAPGPCLKRHFSTGALAKGTLSFGGTPIRRVSSLEEDSTDGPWATASTGVLLSAAESPDGGVWFVDGNGDLGANRGSFRIRRSVSGVLQTIAGPRPDRRLVDGRADGGRLAQPRQLELIGNRLFWSDHRVVRELNLDDALASTIGVHDPRESITRDGAPDAAVFLEPRQLVAHQGGLLVRDASFSIRRVDLASRNVTTVLVWAPDSSLFPAGLGRFREVSGSLWTNTDAQELSPIWLDGGQGPSVTLPFRVEDFDTRGASLVVAGTAPAASFATELFEFDVTTRTVRKLAGQPASQGTTFVAGAVTTARLGAIKNVRLGPGGLIYWSQGDENALNVLTLTGQVRRVIELADTPLDFVVEPAGTLLVLVDAAVLRVVP